MDSISFRFWLPEIAKAEQCLVGVLRIVLRKTSYSGSGHVPGRSELS